MSLTLKYPTQVDTNFKKYYFCYRLQLRIQEINNVQANKVKNGDITMAKFVMFINFWYKPRRNLLFDEILRLRNLAKKKNWNVDLDNIFVER